MNSAQYYTDRHFTPNLVTKKASELPVHVPNSTRFSKPPGIPFRTMLQNPSRQLQSQEALARPLRYAQLSNLEAAFAAIPNENTTKEYPNIPELLKKLTDKEMNMARETYF